ncbi:MAG: ATP-binding protein [Ideonella sp. WA131b]|nr:ATP-binding protein [Ideonella sp. WA131b]
MSIGVESIPGARRLIKSLRDMGYDFESAVADLVDNSIAARANTVRINSHWAGADTSVSIADNGVGMSAQELREALRFGSDRDYEDDDLGKFGLGLKTASLSQCQRLIVASRQNESRADINAYCWDLPHIEATNRWEILPVRTADLPELVRLHLKETTGTVVVWQQLDRILGYNNPSGEPARKKLIEMCGKLEEHVAMVFHRFLENRVRGKRLAIYINDNKVTYWDPFVANEPKRKALDSISLRVDGHGGRSDVVFEPYVLPALSMFSTPEAHKRASGPNQWNRQQGFYIYRADRLIQSGGWSSIRTLDEHLKLARIAVYFSPKLDEEFKINVPKMKVAFPAEIRAEVEKAVKIWTKVADETYRKANKGSGGGALPPAPASLVSTAGKPSAGVSSSSSSGIPASATSAAAAASTSTASNSAPAPRSASVTVDELARVGKLLRRVAKPDEIPVIESTVARAQSTLDE